MTTRHPIRDLGSWLGLAAGVFALLGLLASAPRAAESEIARIAEVLRLRAGQVVADVGAGEGEWSEELSRLVGDRGHVFATEVAPGLVQALGDRFQRAGLTNVEAVLGHDDATGLQPVSCDAILLRLVYHHLKQPAAFGADLRQVLRPSGRLAVIDMRPHKDWRPVLGVPDRGGHGVDPDSVIAEMDRAGFRAVERHDEWPTEAGWYCVVFERR